LEENVKRNLSVLLSLVVLAGILLAVRLLQLKPLP
jgi:hypothetical protein